MVQVNQKSEHMNEVYMKTSVLLDWNYEHKQKAILDTIILCFI